MSLQIETFANPQARFDSTPRNAAGGASLFKALGHPLSAAAAQALAARLKAAGRIAIYDPDGIAESFAELYGLETNDIAGIFVPRIEHIGREILGRKAQPVTELAGAGVSLVFAAVFDAGKRLDAVRHLLPPAVPVLSLDQIRLPDELLTNAATYLDPLNFATNFAFLRDRAGRHTRITTANYWAGYGAKRVKFFLCLFDAAGRTLARWIEPVAPGPSSFVLDSREVRERFGLGDFAGSLFLHAIGAKGHDVVKYALDTFDDEGRELSATHDANAWPADLYAGLPAPDAGERVTLWVQNSHPAPIPAGAIGLNPMGDETIARLEQEIPPFASFPLDVGTLLPGARWPAQIEIRAGRHFVRPRYEIEDAKGRFRIAHANVERTDLVPDPALPGLGNLLGKGYILPFPILPLDEFASFALPTPMTTAQAELPLTLSLYDADGSLAAEQYLGRVPRRESRLLEIDAHLAEAGAALTSGHGHFELRYDFRAGGEADGWLHAIARYHLRDGGPGAETSFGAHIYNTPLLYRDEPQSYSGPPPGLTTRLFLRLGPEGWDTICHLVHPASLPTPGASATELRLYDASGTLIAIRPLAIPCSGSRFWRYSEVFSADERKAAGDKAYILVRDTTCRLFGFHGLCDGRTRFSFDHMFGF